MRCNDVSRARGMSQVSCVWLPEACLHVLDASARELHRGVLELHLRAPDVIHTRPERRKRADRGDLDRRLVGNTVPVLLGWHGLWRLRRWRGVLVDLLWLWRLVMLGLLLLLLMFRCRTLGCRRCLGCLAGDGVGVRRSLLRLLLVILGHVSLLRLLLLGRGRAVKSVCGGLCRPVRVETTLGNSRASARCRRVAGRAVLDGRVHALRLLVRNLERESLDLLLPGYLVLGVQLLRVHRGDAGVVVLRHVVGVRHAGSAVHHADAGVLLVWRLLLVLGHRKALVFVGVGGHAVPVGVLGVLLGVLLVVRNGVAHLLTEVAKGSGPVHVAVRNLANRHDALSRPVHGSVLWCRWGLAAFRVRGAVVQKLVGVHAALVRAALVLDHGRLAAEAVGSVLAFTKPRRRYQEREGRTSSDSHRGHTCRDACQCGYVGDGQGWRTDHTN
jgi:hypothetical protein